MFFEKWLQIKTRKMAFLFIGCLGLLLLVGCGKESKENETLIQDIISPNSTVDAKIACDSYSARTMALSVPEDETVSFAVSFVNNKYVCQATYSQRLYLYNLENEERTTIVPGKEDEYIVGLAAKEDAFCCLVANKENHMRMLVFEIDGSMRYEFSLAESENLDEFVVEKLLWDAEDHYYIQGADKLYVINSEGKICGDISLGDCAITDCVIGKNGKVYLVGSHLNMDMLLYVLDDRQMTAEYIATLSGNGKLYEGIEKDLTFVSGRYLYDYDANAKKEQVVCELTENYINPQMLYMVSGMATDDFTVCTWNRFTGSEVKSPQYYTLSKMTHEEKAAALNQEKEVIKIYKTGISYELPDLIFSFQQEYPRYEVILEENDAALEDAKTFMNVKLLTGESPDLILIDSDNYDVYRDGGALADLTPFMMKSENLNEGALIETILAPYHMGDATYGLPLSFCIQTLVGNDDKIGDIRKKGLFEYYDGCTMIGFTDYLKKHPEIKFQFDGNPMGIMQMYLKTGMGQFLDAKTGTCSFDSSEFLDLVQRTEGLFFDSNYFDPNEWSELAKKEKTISEERIYFFTDMVQLSKIYGEKVICFGYPSDDGELHSILSPFEVFGIPERSTHKEGAWTFLEYYYEHATIPGIPAVKRRFEEKYQDAVTYFDSDAKLSRKKDAYLGTVLKLVEAGKVQTYQDRIIWRILEEELPAVYRQGRDPSEVLSIIQNRVQLYMWENE